MTKPELIRQVQQTLKANNKKKFVRAQKHRLTITTEDGQEAHFNLKRDERELEFTQEDITSMVDAVMEVILKNIKVGEPINIIGFGSIGLSYHKPRKDLKHPTNGEFYDIPGRWKLKFNPGKELKDAELSFNTSYKDGSWNEYLKQLHAKNGGIGSEELVGDTNES